MTWKRRCAKPTSGPSRRDRGYGGGGAGVADTECLKFGESAILGRKNIICGMVGVEVSHERSSDRSAEASRPPPRGGVGIPAPPRGGGREASADRSDERSWLTSTPTIPQIMFFLPKIADSPNFKHSVSATPAPPPPYPRSRREGPDVGFAHRRFQVIRHLGLDAGNRKPEGERNRPAARPVPQGHAPDRPHRRVGAHEMGRERARAHHDHICGILAGEIARG